MKKALECGCLQDGHRLLADDEVDLVAGGVWCSYAPALVAIHWMTGVSMGSFVCDDGTIA